ncbi:MAG: HAD family phosphatase [Rhizobiaceae bacterium]|nr:HAD family phosphatase [Rhizobiaceae bacterium]
MPEIKLVIFDCDGVLVDSEIIAAKIEAETYRDLGYEIENEEFAIRFAGSSGADIRAEIEKELNFSFPDNVISGISGKIDEAVRNEVKIIPGADEMLDMFDQPRCICSNSPSNRLKDMLTRVKLYDRFRPYIFSAKDFDPPANKPKPDVFLKALKEFDVKPEEAIVVEDSSHGVTAARAAGVRVIGFTGGSHTWHGHADILTESGAETVIKSFRHLPTLIEAFGDWGGEFS